MTRSKPPSPTPIQAEFDRLEREIVRLTDLLIKIGHYAHDKSEGPESLDGYYRIMRMAFGSPLD